MDGPNRSNEKNKTDEPVEIEIRESGRRERALLERRSQLLHAQVADAIRLLRVHLPDLRLLALALQADAFKAISAEFPEACNRLKDRTLERKVAESDDVKDAAMLKLAKELTRGNSYTTTIHAINSCVIKLSKLTKAGKVWRGIKDAKLPPEFWVPNAMGIKGGIEFGFSSTTTDRAQAMHYAQGGEGMGGKQGGGTAAMTIFEMQMGMVDRGADLTWLSQYPHEREVLLPPLTGIEALGTDVQGSMLVIHSRLSLNLASHTLEQVLSRRRKMLMDMVDGIVLEMRDALGDRGGHGGSGLRRPAQL